MPDRLYTVYQHIFPNGNQAIYNSLREVARTHNVSSGTVHKYIYKCTQYKGYTWRYAE